MSMILTHSLYIFVRKYLTTFEYIQTCTLRRTHINTFMSSEMVISSLTPKAQMHYGIAWHDLSEKCVFKNLTSCYSALFSNTNLILRKFLLNFISLNYIGPPLSNTNCNAACFSGQKWEKCQRWRAFSVCSSSLHHIFASTAASARPAPRPQTEREYFMCRVLPLSPCQIL